MKSLLFIPSRPYRSDSVYISVSKELKHKYPEAYTICLDLFSDKHSLGRKVDVNKRYSLLSKHFDEVIFKTLIEAKNKGRFNTWRLIFNLNREIAKVIRKFNPKVIIMNSLHAPYSFFLHDFSNKYSFELVCIQTVANSTTPLRILSINNASVKDMLFRYFLIYNSYFLPNKKLKFLSWNGNVNNSRNTHLVLEEYSLGNVMFDKPLSQFKGNLVSKINEIIIISQPIFHGTNGEYLLNFYKSIVLYVKSKNLSLRIISHPRQKINELANLLDINTQDAEYSDSFENSIVENAIFITTSSAYALDWINRGFPVFSITEPNKKDYSNVFGPNFNYYIYSIDQFKKEINRWIERPVSLYKQFLKNRTHIIKGYNKHTEPKALHEVSSFLMKFLK